MKIYDIGENHYDFNVQKQSNLYPDVKQCNEIPCSDKLCTHEKHPSLILVPFSIYGYARSHPIREDITSGAPST